MSAQPSDTLQRIPMTWEHYESLDEPVPSEYYGGALVVVPTPSQGHQHVVGRIWMILEETAPEGVRATMGWGWSPAGVREELIPDVMVHARTSERARFTGVPLLAVEVLSTNRSDDLVMKTQRYADWGLQDYWIVDPRDRVIRTYRFSDGDLVERQRFIEGRVTLTYGDVEVPVDIDELLAP